MTTAGGDRGTAVVAVPRPTATLVRRALRERRVMRQAQASQVVLSRRWVAAAAAASSVYCPVQRFQLEEMRRVVARSRRLASQVSCRQQQQQHSAAAVTTAANSAATFTPATPPPSPSPSSLAPEPYFELLLSQRGRLPQKIDTVRAGYSAAPSAKQIQDYQAQPFMSDHARRGDIEGLKKAVEAGRGMVSQADRRRSSSSSITRSTLGCGFLCLIERFCVFVCYPPTACSHSCSCRRYTSIGEHWISSSVA